MFLVPLVYYLSKVFKANRVFLDLISAETTIQASKKLQEAAHMSSTELQELVVCFCWGWGGVAIRYFKNGSHQYKEYVHPDKIAV